MVIKIDGKYDPGIPTDGASAVSSSRPKPNKATRPSAALQAALSLQAAGFSIIPVKVDGSKGPDLSTWKRYQSEIACEDVIQQWLANWLRGIGIVCGPVSGGLHVVDIEFSDFFEAFTEIVEAQRPGLMARLPIVKTPGRTEEGGRHVYSRCAEVRRSTKLARISGEEAQARTGDAGKTTAIELRGDGSYVLAPGCPPHCHESGRSYEHLSGPKIEDTPTLTAEEFEILIAAAQALNRVAKDEVNGGAASAAGDRPGDRFNREADWAGILEPHDWQVVGKGGPTTYFRRPGKTSGLSATAGYCTSKASGSLLYVFTTNAQPFDSERAYSKFAAYALLNFRGDWSAAARQLAAEGYGDQDKQTRVKLGNDTAANAAVRLLNGHANGQASGDGQAADGKPKAESSRCTILASEIQPGEMEWLWEPRVPLGMLTTFAGQGGLGKTFCLLSMAALVSRGGPWPDGSGNAPLGKVLFISGEDDLSRTLVPRLIAMDADRTKIAFFKEDVQSLYDMGNLTFLDRAISEVGDGVKMLVIDPPSAFLNGVDEHKNAEVRRLLAPLAAWSERNRIATILNTHVSKPGNNKVSAMMRTIGSVAWVNAVRASYMFISDSEDPERVLFLPTKNNNGPRVKGLAYRIAPVGKSAKVEWLGEVDMTADEAMNQETGTAGKKRGLDATEWLAEVIFKDVSFVPANDIWKRKKAETDISDHGLRGAADTIGVDKKREKGEDGKFASYWHWPHEARARWLLQKQTRAKANEDVAEF